MNVGILQSIMANKFFFRSPSCVFLVGIFKPHICRIRLAWLYPPTPCFIGLLDSIISGLPFVFLVFFFFSIRSVPKRDGVWIRVAWNWVGVFTLVVILGVYTGGLVGLGWVRLG